MADPYLINRVKNNSSIFYGGYNFNFKILCMGQAKTGDGNYLTLFPVAAKFEKRKCLDSKKLFIFEIEGDDNDTQRVQ